MYINVFMVIFRCQESYIFSLFLSTVYSIQCIPKIIYSFYTVNFCMVEFFYSVLYGLSNQVKSTASKGEKDYTLLYS